MKGMKTITYNKLNCEEVFINKEREQMKLQQ